MAILIPSLLTSNKVYSFLNVNHAPEIITGPTAVPEAIKEDEISALSVTATDADGDALTYAWSTTSGSIIGSGASVTYKPVDMTKQTIDTVSVIVDDGNGGSVAKSVDIIVNPVIATKTANINVGTNSGKAGENGVVILMNFSSAPKGELITAISFDLLYDQTALKVESVIAGPVVTAAEKTIMSSYPKPGTLRVIVFGLNQCTMGDGVLADISFGILAGSSAGKKELKLDKYLASDKDAKSVTLNAVNGEIEVLEHSNHPPTADSQTISTEEDKAISATLSGSDPDSDTLTYIIMDQPLHGSFFGTESRITYAPAENYNGSDSFSFKVNDGKVDSNIAVVAINVSPVNDAPVLAKIENKEIEAGKELKFELSAVDLDGDKLEFSMTNAPRGASIDKNTGEFNWKPRYDQAGQYEIEFKVEDADRLSDSRKAKIKVTKEEMPPEGDIHINGGAKYTNVEDVVLTLSADDKGGSGIELMQLSNNGNSFSDYEPYATSKSWVLSRGEGKKQVYVRFKDQADNESKIYSAEITLDETEPSGELKINNGADYINNLQVMLGLAANDNLSGVSKVRIKNEGDPVEQEFVYEKEYSWKLAEGDGMKRVYVELEDGAGNKSRQSIIDGIILDTVEPNKPEIKEIAPPLQKGTVMKSPIALTGTKEKNTGIFINAAEKIALDDDEIWTTQVKLKEGVNILKITSKDAAGNESVAEELTVKLKTKINFRIIQPSKKYVSKQDLIGDSSDVMILYAIDDDKAVRNQRESLKEGSNIITISAQDEFGNEDKYDLDLVLDTQNPQIEITSHKDGQDLTTQSINLGGTVTDTTSGVDDVKINGKTAVVLGNEFTGGVNLSRGVNTIAIEAQDKAGNITSVSLSLNYLEKPQTQLPEQQAPASFTSTAVTTEETTAMVPAQTIAIASRYEESSKQETKKGTSKAVGKVIKEKSHAEETIQDNEYLYPVERDRDLSSETPDEYYDEQEKQNVAPIEPSMSKYKIAKDASGKKLEKLPAQAQKAETKEEKAPPEIIIIVKPVKKFMIWRSYELKMRKGAAEPISWELGTKQKLPFMLKLDKKKGTIYGIVWGKGRFKLRLNMIAADKQVIESSCKLMVD